MALARLASVALDCVDPAELAAFWAELIGGDVVFTSAEFCAVATGGLYLAAVRVADHVPPTWPGGPAPKQVHLDLAVADLDAAVAEAVRLGAAEEAEQSAPERFRVLRDPAGHPFCLTTAIPEP